jgi:hypothetical protein
MTVKSIRPADAPLDSFAGHDADAKLDGIVAGLRSVVGVERLVDLHRAADCVERHIVAFERRDHRVAMAGFEKPALTKAAASCRTPKEQEFFSSFHRLRFFSTGFLGVRERQLPPSSRGRQQAAALQRARILLHVSQLWFMLISLFKQ